MKKTFLVFLFICQSFVFYAQIMVGENNPISDNSVFEVKGNLPAKDSIDLFLIDNQGNIGLGVINPKAKLHITKSKDIPPLRIEDGKAAVGQVISSDSEGYLQWIDMPTPEASNYYCTPSEVITYKNDGTNYLLLAMPVQTAGMYQVVLRWWGTSDLVDVNNNTAALFSLTNSNTDLNNWSVDQLEVQDQSEQTILASDGKYFCFTMMLSASVTTVPSFLKLYLKLTLGGPWKIGVASLTSTLWNPSVVVFKF